MIITVTLNPSIDRTMEIDELTCGEVLRAAATHLDPGGKGVNVSRALLANGIPSRALLPYGGDEGAQLVRLLQAEGVDLVAVPITGRTRVNITLVEDNGAVTKINESGPVLSGNEIEELSRAVLGSAGADWVVACGSLPPGLPIDGFRELCERIVLAGVRLAVDTSGPALRAAAEAGAALLKPNREELAEVVGAPLDTLDDVVDAAERVREWGAGTVLASLGSEGAVLVDGEQVITAHAPVARPRSTVGAGDALLAGFLAGGARGQEALAEAVAWGAAAVSLPGSRMPRPADLRRRDVQVRPRPDLLRSAPTRS